MVKRETNSVTGTVPARGVAAAVSVLFAVVMGWRTYLHEAAVGLAGGDFGHFRNAALKVLAGVNPYDTGVIPYPLPALLLVSPLTPLPPVIGAGVFSGIGVAALTYGLLTRFGWSGLVMLLSPAFFLGWFYLQWSPLIVAGALLPWIAGLGIAKPNVAFAPFAYRPTWRMIALASLLVVVSFAVIPSWLSDWLVDVPQQRAPHTAPLLWPVGGVGLVGGLRWRRPEGRALLAMTLTPLNPQIYDHLGVWLATPRWGESLALSVCAWVGFFAFVATAPHDLTKNATPAHLSLALGVYLPAAIIVLRRPNTGPVPERIERFALRLPRWLRGRAT
jgi:hypothetical protein